MLTISPGCTSCGACARACPAGLLCVTGGVPTAGQGQGCIRCGHCEAVCPSGVLKNKLLPQDHIQSLPTGPVLSPHQAGLFLRSRRSIRQYLPQPVEQPLVERLLDMGRYAQTGVNRQGVTYLVAQGEALAHLRELTWQFYEKKDPAQAAMREDYANTGRDKLFRGAPMLVLALTERGESYLAANARFSLTYLELFAPALGLGTCWAGYLEAYTSTDCPRMRRLLDIPDHLVVSGALMLGYPAIRYYRTVGRSPLQTLWRSAASSGNSPTPCGDKTT